MPYSFHRTFSFIPVESQTIHKNHLIYTLLLRFSELEVYYTTSKIKTELR